MQKPSIRSSLLIVALALFSIGNSARATSDDSGCERRLQYAKAMRLIKNCEGLDPALKRISSLIENGDWETEVHLTISFEPASYDETEIPASDARSQAWMAWLKSNFTKEEASGYAQAVSTLEHRYGYFLRKLQSGGLAVTKPRGESILWGSFGVRGSLLNILRFLQGMEHTVVVTTPEYQPPDFGMGALVP